MTEKLQERGERGGNVVELEVTTEVTGHLSASPTCRVNPTRQSSGLTPLESKW